MSPASLMRQALSTADLLDYLLDDNAAYLVERYYAIFALSSEDFARR